MFKNDEGGVWLGVPLLKKEKNVASFRVSKVGGLPDWKREKHEQEISCSVCSSLKCLVVQIYAPIPEHPSRTLYVFACCNLGCRNPNTWEVIRLQEPEDSIPAFKTSFKQEAEKVSLKNPEVTNEDSLPKICWNVGEADGAESGFDEIEKLLDSRASIQVKSTDLKPNPEKNERGRKSLDDEASKNETVHGVRLLVIEEPDYGYTNVKEDLKIERILEKYRSEEEEDISRNAGRGDTGLNFGAENYEEGPPKDLVLEIFQSRISLEPTQCIRYAFGGCPLWPIPEYNLKISPCSECGSPRKFEMQLMPGMLNLDVRVANGGGLFDSMDWSSVLVYSCENSCEAGMKEQLFILPPIT